MNEDIYGITAEFENASALLKATGEVKSAGYKKFGCYSPFPVHGMDEAMGLKRSPLGYIVGIIAFVGLFIGLYMQWFTNVYDYKYVILGKPFFSFQTYAPVGFGMAVLFGAFAAFFGMLILNKLPKFFHPLFYSDRFKKVIDDGFFINIESYDKKFDCKQTAEFLKSIGGTNIEVLKS